MIALFRFILDSLSQQHNIKVCWVGSINITYRTEIGILTLRTAKGFVESSLRNVDSTFAITDLSGDHSADKILLLPVAVNRTRRVMIRLDSIQLDAAGVFTTVVVL